MGRGGKVKGRKAAEGDRAYGKGREG